MLLAGNIQVYIVQYRVTGAVGEAYVLVLDPTPYARQCPGVGPVTDTHRYLDQIEDAPGGGHGALKQVNGFGQAGKRPEQALGEEHQYPVGAHIELAFQGHPSAQQESRDEAGQDGHANNRDECRN